MSTEDHAQSQAPSTRSFSEGHKAALTAAARLRSQEQAVGNYVRRWNSEIFALLLGEALSPPTSQTLGTLLAALKGEVSPAPKGFPPTTVRGGESISAPNSRPPPPKMDIT